MIHTANKLISESHGRGEPCIEKELGNVTLLMSNVPILIFVLLSSYFKMRGYAVIIFVVVFSILMFFIINHHFHILVKIHYWLQRAIGEWS